MWLHRSKDIAHHHDPLLQTAPKGPEVDDWNGMSMRIMEGLFAQVKGAY